MKVNKLTQLLEAEKSLDDYKNKIKDIKRYLTFTIDGNAYDVLDKFKKDEDEIIGDFSDSDNRNFLFDWAKALGLKFKDFKKDDFTEHGYLENGMSLRITYIITFFDHSSLHIDYEDDGYLTEVGIENKGKMAEDFKNDCDKEILIFYIDDLDDFKPQKFIAPSKTKPKVEID